jgi:hypothetical protein
LDIDIGIDPEHRKAHVGPSRRAYPSVLAVSSLLAALLVANAAPGQEAPPLVGREAPHSKTWVAVGYDKTWLADLGYARTVWRPAARQAVGLRAGLRLPLVLVPEFDSYGLAAGPEFSFVSVGGFGLASSIYGSMRTASDTTGTKFALRVSSELRPGYYQERWSLALNLSVTTTLSTYVHHSDAVRDLFRDRYPGGMEPLDVQAGPKDGFYALTSHELRVGSVGGWRVTRAIAVYGGAGWTLRRQLGSITANPPISALPLLAQIGGQLRW